MLKAAIVFFCLGVLSIYLGASQVSGLAVEIGRILLGVFLLVTALNFVVSMVSGKKTALVAAIAMVFLVSFSPVSQADETIGTKAKTVIHETKTVVKKTYRKAKDETCTLVKGRMECAVEKVKHSVQNAVE